MCGVCHEPWNSCQCSLIDVDNALRFPCLLKLRFLNLCSGTGSVSRPFKEAGYDVVDVDWDNCFGPTHCVDIMTRECLYPEGRFDVVWASPDCTQYIRARATAKTPRNFGRADGLVKRCLEPIRELQPRVWFLENPDSRLLKTFVHVWSAVCSG